MSEELLKFTFSGKMARLLGRESVSSDVAALLELVKNSHDADAKNVKITFQGLMSKNKNDIKITIEDDGHGMDARSIKNKWMVIGTDDKEIHQKTRSGKRYMVGNKGIGRFATEKLCKKTTLISKPIESYKKFKLTINWNEYEKSKAIFENITFPLETINREKFETYGTTIILEEIRESWPIEKISGFQTALNSLSLPKELATHDDIFNINIITEDNEKIDNIKIQNDLLKYAPYELISKIDNEGEMITIIKKRKKNILIEKQNLTDEKIAGYATWKPFGKCVLNCYIFPKDSIYEKWDKYYKSIKIGNINRMLKQLHGIRIYRDGFWVRPYGSPYNDWLDLEGKRVQSNLRLGNTQIIGFIKITKVENPLIQDTTTRERLIENDDFYSLRFFGEKSLDVMYKYRKQQNTKYKEEGKKIHHENMLNSDIQSIDRLVSNAKIESTKKNMIKSKLKNINKTFKNHKEIYDNAMIESSMNRRMYRNLASLGISTAATSHEIGPISNNLGLIIKTIKQEIQKHEKLKKILESEFIDADNNIKTIGHYIHFVSQFVKKISGSSERKHEKHPINVYTEIDNFLRGFDYLVKDEKVHIDKNEIPKKMSINMRGADFSSIFLNLYTNSLKSLLYPTAVSKPKIKITVTNDSKNFQMKFSDNGRGIKKINRNKIFELLYTTFEQGTGLGMSILKEILEDYNGTIELSEHSELKNGATFIIKIPWNELKIGN